MTDKTPEEEGQEPLFDMPAEDTTPSDEEQSVEESTGSEQVSPVPEEEESSASLPTGATGETLEKQEQVPIEDDVSDSKRRIFLSLGVVGALLLGGAGAYGYEHFSQNNQAQTQLQEAIDARSDISAINTDVMDYSGGDDSYALGVGGAGNHPSSGAFVFGSEQGEYNRVVDVYIDYSNTRSRDFFFANNAMLRGLIESSEVQLRLHAVPSDHPYSMYAAETMAQVFNMHPEKAWEVHISLLQLSEEILEMDEPSREDMLSAIESELERFHDISDVDTELIMDGMFTDWITATGSDSRLQANAYPPLVYSNGQLVNTDTYYTPDELRGNILSPAETSFTDDEITEEVSVDPEAGETDIDGEENPDSSEDVQENDVQEETTEDEES